jgi:HK97 family phage prohead protease
MNRAYSILTVKAVEEDQRIIRGMATTPSPDRVGDIVEPLGVKFKNPMPLLWQHDAKKPVGTVTFDKPTKAGIGFVAKIAHIDEPGTLKDRLDEAWQSVKLKLVSAVSIGFRSLEHAFIEGTGGVRFLESEVMELSLVTIPANADATITQIKSIDTEIRAASGIKDGEGRPEIQTDANAATGRKVRVVRLNDPARDRAGKKPFVIRQIRH